jgi:superfamily II DNA or RNA helicase
MPDILKIIKKNEVYFRISCDAGIAHEICDAFKFEVPNAKFHPKVKAGVWDGYIRLFNLKTREFPIGLYSELKKFCSDREYEIEYYSNDVVDRKKITPKEIHEYVNALNIHSNKNPISVYPYQLQAIFFALKNKRNVILSPTGSGKSLIIYSIARYLLDLNKKILVVVPSVALVEQLYKDIADYSTESNWDSVDNTHLIYSGRDKTTEKSFTISTWQSLQNFPESHFAEYDCVICDETHLAKANQLQKILVNCCNAEYRFGLTGSLDNSETNAMMIRGMLGEIIRVASTRELIDSKKLSDIKIKALALSYPKEVSKLMASADYKTELDFLVGNSARNNFIKNLAISLPGNTLVMYSLVEKHGKILNDLISASHEKTFFIHGGVDVDDRENLRNIMESSTNNIAVVSYGTFSTGVNIKNIDNIIAASPTKSVVRVLQSIGRGLRKKDGKTHFTWYDISDKLVNSKSNPNHTWGHFKNRLQIYMNEQFDYSITEIALK